MTEENIHSFLRITPELAADEIAGFLRYEEDPSGNRTMPDVYKFYRWKPESVRRRQAYLVAEFTNEHAGFLPFDARSTSPRRFIGRICEAPYQGRYQLPETAATDPYTECGFRKVICISGIAELSHSSCSPIATWVWQGFLSKLLKNRSRRSSK